MLRITQKLKKCHLNVLAITGDIIFFILLSFFVSLFLIFLFLFLYFYFIFIFKMKETYTKYYRSKNKLQQSWLCMYGRLNILCKVIVCSLCHHGDVGCYDANVVAEIEQEMQIIKVRLQ